LEFPRTICVDVGASYFAHTSWWFFLGVSRTTWLAIDPNAENLNYAESWPWRAQLKLETSCLSEFGGLSTFYKTNVDSGSSLLRPVIDTSSTLHHRHGKIDYFHPVQEIQIETKRISDVLAELNPGPIIIKLDTQGSELSIIRDLLQSPLSHLLIGIEVECSLLANPTYENSPRLWEVAHSLEESGFELLNLDVFPSRQPSTKYRARSRNISSECDAIFARRRDVIASPNIELREVLLGFYLTNAFYHEALTLIVDDSEVQSDLASKGIDVSNLQKVLKRRCKTN